ncbi:MAG: tetratricopeptide repeat protein, partial [Chloroflexota bacterium]|nr:tetratricopeptide repeat protein [Chloroflexota bacterium]
QEVMYLCQWVNSNPLAIELAAHWMQYYRLGEMISLLEQQNLALLATDRQDVPARHHTMTAVFETSWQLLSPHQQQTLAQLSVFRGAFTREAAAAVTDAILPTLVALVNSSLLRQVRDSSGRVAYIVHELLRHFAAAKLRTVEQALLAAAPIVQRHHSEYYLRLVAAQGEALYGSEMQSALAELQTNIDNIRAAWRWAVSSDSVALLRQAWFGLRTFYHVRCLFQEGEEVFRTAAADLQSYLPAQADRDEVAAELQIAQAFFLNHLNRHDQAITLACAVLATMQGQAATPVMARATLECGIGLSSRGQHDEALTTLTQAATLARHLSLPALEARARHAMSRNLLYKGEFAEAEAALEQALHGYQQVGYHLAEGFVLRALGNLAYHAGRYSEALAQLEAALVIYQAAEDQPREISLWKFLGDVYAALGDLGRALAYYRATYARRAEVEDSHHTAFLLARYAILLGRLGDCALACQYAEQALTQQQQMGHQGGTVEALCALGWLQNQLGNPAQALAYYRQAVETIRTSSNTVYEGAATLGMGTALAGCGAWREAQAVYQQALAIQRQLGRQPAVIETLCELARLALAQGLAADALQLVDEILAAGDLATVQGVNEPLLCDLTCYQVLQANGDVRAGGVLVAAYHRLESQAATLDDDRLRQSFLENVPVNQLIVAAYLDQNTQQDSPGNG